MIEDKKILAIVTARGGSKGLESKNIKPLHGKPLLAWTIEAARKSRYIDRLIVSTDDEKIAEISKNLGADIPFMRPIELATDSAKSVDVVLHAIEYFQKQNEKYDIVIVLQPTSPLRVTEDIDSALDLFISRGADSVISVCETEHHPAFANTLPEDLSMKGFLREEVINKSRQELPKFYRINGAVYVAATEFVLTHRSFIGDETFAFVMPKQRSIDINDEIDFKLAELLLE